MTLLQKTIDECRNNKEFQKSWPVCKHKLEILLMALQRQVSRDEKLTRTERCLKIEAIDDIAKILEEAFTFEPPKKPERPKLSNKHVSSRRPSISQ